MVKDKKITLNQLQKLMNEAYDYLEDISLETMTIVLKEDFNFTDEMLEKFKERYLEEFGESVARYIVEKREFVTRTVKKRAKK